MLEDQITSLLVEHQGKVVEAEVGVRDDPVVIEEHVSKEIYKQWKKESKRVMRLGLLNQHHHSPQHIHNVVSSDALLLQLPAEDAANLILTDQSLFPFLMVIRNIEHYCHAIRYHLLAALL